jgi:hypothetical protein
MTKEIIHKTCRVICYIAILNFISFFIISILIGGDALNGEVQNGHYYLGGGGNHTEVVWLVFIYSKLHAFSVFITFPLAALAALVFWITGGKVDRKAVTRAIKKPPNHPISHILHIIGLFFWRMFDFVEGIYWIMLDSWRKPNVEFFTSFSKEQCIVKVSEALDREPSFYGLTKPIGGRLYGTYFYLLKGHPYNIIERNPVMLILSGKFVPTSHGTYIRAWHRFSTGIILFLVVWFGMATFFITLFAMSTIYPSQSFLLFGYTFPNAIVFYGVIPLAMSVSALMLIWISAQVGKRRNVDLAHFLRQVFATDVNSA